MNDKWIEVGERLPGENISVLIYDDDRETIFKGYHAIGSWWFGDHYGRYDSPIVGGTITHWRPLPNPPVMHNNSLNTDTAEPDDEHPEWNTFIRYHARARGQ